MTVLVTGATGFIGPRIVSRLREAGLQTKLASRRPRPSTSAEAVFLLPAANAPDEAFLDLTRGVTHVVHCAALNNDHAAGDADFAVTNATLTGRLAQAAAKHATGRFIYLSSIRAVAGPGFNGTIDETTMPTPDCAYGRSKRDGEIGMLGAYASAGREDATALRLPPVYGEGMKGNLAALLRLAGSPLPLPRAVLTGVRSLISSEMVADAVVHLLTRPGPLRPAYIAADAAPLALSSVIGAFRQGLGRPPGLLPLPGLPFRLAATLAGRRTSWQALTATQICNPALLVSEGWRPGSETLDRLRDLARRSAQAVR